MADRRRDVRLAPHHSLTSHRAVGSAPARPNVGALTAAAQLLTDVVYTGHDRGRDAGIESWQSEAWDYYESMGEFNYGVEWFGESCSRVRLNVAVVTPGGDEPEILTDGPAADIISKLNGGTDGQAQLLRSLAVHLAVPGDAYLVGRAITEAELTSGVLLDAEPDENNHVWTVQPATTMRRSRRSMRSVLRRFQRPWELQVSDTEWIPLPDDSLVCRIWDRNERAPWRAISPAKPALPIMREIDMYNRRIIAELVSRVALNGMLLIPDEATLPSSPQYEEASDPFIAELLDIMRNAIKNPGSAASAAPMPLRISAEYIDKIKHLTFSTPLDEKIFEARDGAIHRLASTLNLPAEIITGMGDVNHWSSWQLSEDAIKTHISPKIEIITRCLTIGYLHPLLRAAGEDVRDGDGNRIIVWYDTSELTQRPDRSGSAIELRRMKVISDAATRRETGFDEADAPTDDELERMILIETRPRVSVLVPCRL